MNKKMKMNLSDCSIALTPKGVDEAMHRTYKVNVKYRSVLIHLGTKPQSVEHTLHIQSVFGPDEIIEAISDLIREGFVAVHEAEAAAPAAADLRLQDGIILAEAKYLLVDFCANSFGTQSQMYADEIGKCKNEQSLRVCLKNIYAVTLDSNPDRLPFLQKTVAEINQTA
jgi:hypothetical protein